MFLIAPAFEPMVGVAAILRAVVCSKLTFVDICSNNNRRLNIFAVIQIDLLNCGVNRPPTATIKLLQPQCVFDLKDGSKKQNDAKLAKGNKYISTTINLEGSAH